MQEKEINIEDEIPSPNEKRILRLLEVAGKKCMVLLQSVFYTKKTLKALANELGFSNEHSLSVQKYKCIQKLKRVVKQKSMQSNVVPMVIDSSENGERAYDIYSLLLKERIVFIGGSIDSSLANVVVAQLLYLNSINNEAAISLYIHSPGGAVYSGLAIYDTIKMIHAPVSTYSVGFTGSMGTFLLSSGTKGQRFALPHSTIHMHPTGGGSQGYMEDVKIATHEQERLQTQLFHIMGQQTNRDWQEIENFFLRDKFLNAQEAKEFGLVDEVLGSTDDLIFLNPNNPTIHVLNQEPKNIGLS